MISMVDKCINEVSDFFELPKIDINIHLVQSREEFDKLEGNKTEDWVVGFTKNDTIYVLDPNKFEEYSTHPKTDFESVLKHEIAHMYYKELNTSGHPNWLDEGVACFVDGNNKYLNPEKVTLKTLKGYYDSVDGEIYGIGRFMVAKIIEEFGKHRLFELIKIKSPETLYRELVAMFEWLT